MSSAPRHWLHCVVIALLYVCQGLVTGTIQSLPVLLVDLVPTFSSTQVAVLGMPMYVFAAKFIWAPAVDRWYSRYLAGATKAPSKSPRRKDWVLHRRVQYVLPLQVCLALLFGLLAWMSGPVADYEDESFLRWIGQSDVTDATSGVVVVALTLTVMAFCSATQDIAVDAWAVEGMSSEYASLAGTLQMVGLILGGTSCQLYVMMRAYVTLYGFFVTCAVVSVVAGVAALVLSLAHHPAALFVDDGGAESSMLQEFKDISSAPRSRAFVGILLTRFVPHTLMALLTLRLQAKHVLDATLLSQLRIAGTVISVVTASFLSSKVIERLSSEGTLRFNSRSDLIMCTASVVLYFTVTTDVLLEDGTVSLAFPIVSRNLYIGLIVALSLYSSFISANSFVAVVVQASKEASFFPRSTATTITLFNAMANMGYTLPSSIVMFATDPFARWIAVNVGQPVEVVDRFALSILSCVVLVLAFIARRLILVPCVQLLQLPEGQREKST